MAKLISKTEKEVKLSNRIKEIQNLYDLSFDEDYGDLINVDSFKLNLNLQQNVASIISASELVAKQVKFIDGLLKSHPDEIKLKELRGRLRVVHNEIVKFIKTEFKTIRTKEDLEKAKILNN